MTKTGRKTLLEHYFAHLVQHWQPIFLYMAISSAFSAVGDINHPPPAITAIRVRNANRFVAPQK